MPKTMKTAPASLASLQRYHQEQEDVALEAYSRALHIWERLRDRAHALAEDLEAALVQLQCSTLAGSKAKALAELRRNCRKLQDQERRAADAAARARAEASRCFTVLILARNARAEFERNAQDRTTNILVLPELDFITAPLAEASWN